VAENPEGLEIVTITLQALAERVSQGGTLHDQDAVVVAGSPDLLTIGMMADGIRRRLHGTTTTFLRVFEMHVDAIPSAVPQATAAGEFRIVGCPATAAAAAAAVKRARAVASNHHLTGFSLSDLARLADGSPDFFLELSSAGLDGIGEVPVDLVSAEAIAHARAGGLLVNRLTVSAPPRDVLEVVHTARRLQLQSGGFRAFAPLARAMSIASPTTGYDDVKLVALARLLVRDIPSIQVDWPLYGPKLAQVALTVGADDVDGIAAIETGALGARRSALEEIRRNIRAAGLVPVERDGRFEGLIR
jgi:aminodeoxyfutalosine synthase